MLCIVSTSTGIAGLAIRAICGQIIPARCRGLQERTDREWPVNPAERSRAAPSDRGRSRSLIALLDQLDAPAEDLAVKVEDHALAGRVTHAGTDERSVAMARP